MNNYYIIGTKYGRSHNNDTTPYLQDKKAISMGFCWGMDLTKFYNGDFDKLDKTLRKRGEKPTTISQVKKFLNLQPGDMVALKGVGSPIGNTARLDIVGYAVVVERDGVIYRNDPDDFPEGLGHLINVDFLEFGIKRTLQLGYGQTIHKLDNQDHIEKVFGEYADILESKNGTNKKGTNQKNIDDKLVSISGSYLRTAVHNKIQQGVYNLLVKTYGEKKVKMEENFVDIIVTHNDTIKLIEIKPYESVILCIREGLGQLLSYYHKDYFDNKKVSLKIIGSKEPTVDEKEFIKFIQSTVNIKFQYDSWERLGSG